MEKELLENINSYFDNGVYYYGELYDLIDEKLNIGTKFEFRIRSIRDVLQS
jgi:hypothetical protein